MSKETLKLALEALKTLVDRFDYEQFTSVCELDDAKDAIKALEEALAKQEQGEPVAITITGKLGNIYSFTGDYSLKKGDKVYTTPQQRKPLTDEQIKDVASPCMWWVREQDILDAAIELARAIEAAHGIKE